MDGQIFKVSAEMMHLHAEEQQKGLGTANAASELTFFTEVTFSSSLSSFHFLSFSYSASSLRIYFLLEFRMKSCWASVLLQFQTPLNASFNFII